MNKKLNRLLQFVLIPVLLVLPVIALADEFSVVVQSGQDVSVNGENYRVLDTWSSGENFAPQIEDASGGWRSIFFIGADDPATPSVSAVPLFGFAKPNQYIPLVAANGRTPAGAPFPNGVSFQAITSFPLPSVSLEPPRLTSNQCAVFPATLTGPGIVSGTNSQAFFKYTESSGFRLLFQERQPIAGIPGNGPRICNLGSGLFRPVGISRGQQCGVICSSFVNGSTDSVTDNAIWSAADNVTLLARYGMPAPGMGGAVFSTPIFFDSASNGETYLFGSISGAGVIPSTGTGADPLNANDFGLWKVNNSLSGGVAGLTLIARKGDVAPSSNGLRFATIYRTNTASTPSYLEKPVTSLSGDVAFASSLRNASGINTSVAMFTNMNGQLERAFGVNDPLPDVGPGASLSASSFSTWVNGGQGYFALDAKQGGSKGILFSGKINYPLSQGGLPAIGRWDANTREISILLRSGENAPGLPEGVKILDNSVIGSSCYQSSGSPISILNVNRYGDFIANVSLCGTGVTPDNNNAIFTNIDGVTRLVAREGQTIPGTDLVIKEINSFSSVKINNAGQALFISSIGRAGQFFNAPAILRVDENNNLRLVVTNGGIEPIKSSSGEVLYSASEFRTTTLLSSSLSDDGHISFFAKPNVGSPINAQIAAVVRIVPEEPSTQCSDGVDNDSDGSIDMNDPGCTGESDDNEVGPFSCSDSDEGNNSFIAGHFALSEAGTPRFQGRDQCVNDRVLREYSCTNATLSGSGQASNAYSEVGCKFGCSNGACNPAPGTQNPKEVQQNVVPEKAVDKNILFRSNDGGGGGSVAPFIKNWLHSIGEIFMGIFGF